MKYTGAFKQLHEQFESDSTYKFEELKLTITNELEILMNRLNISNADLAKKLGCSSPYITKLLSGQNLTIKSIARIAAAIGCDIGIKIEPHDLRPEMISQEMSNLVMSGVKITTGGEWNQMVDTSISISIETQQSFVERIDPTKRVA
jgi:transcriptional regulator with XRE-family HTH domain